MGFLIQLVAAIASFVYAAFVLKMLAAWYCIPKQKSGNDKRPFVSVIVCMRNEEKNISQTLTALIRQDYPKDAFEIIVSDDFSEDDSVPLANKMAAENSLYSIRIISANPTQPTGKKFAMAEAVKQARGEVIAMTDADCVMGKNWLTTMVSHHVNTGAQLTTGPVRLTGNSFFHQMQKIEFMSLSGSTGAAIQLKKPLMVNAANMIFNRQAFIDSGRMNPEEAMASGDDTFFMLKLAEKISDAISFCKNKAAIVETPALPSWHEFIQQRIRWASKTKHYPARYIRLTGLGLFAFHFLIVLFFMLALVNSDFLIPALILLPSKWIADGILLSQFNRFFAIRAGWMAWIATFLIHPLYLTLIPLLTLKRNYRWKGRTGKT